MAQVFYHPNKIPMCVYIYILTHILQLFRGSKQKKERAQSGRTMGWMTQSHEHGGHPKTQSHGLALEASASCKRCKCGQPLARLPELTLRVRESSGQAVCLGQPGHQKSSIPAVIVPRPWRCAHCVCGLCPTLPTSPTHWRDAGRIPAPLLVLPPAPPSSSTVG
jgi:hypothetical protein